MHLDAKQISDKPSRTVMVDGDTGAPILLQANVVDCRNGELQVSFDVPISQEEARAKLAEAVGETVPANHAPAALERLAIAAAAGELPPVMNITGFYLSVN